LNNSIGSFVSEPIMFINFYKRTKQKWEYRARGEDLGVQLEHFGRSPVAARVQAFLLLSEPPYPTFDEI
jgi:hypothetical protein